MVSMLFSFQQLPCSNFPTCSFLIVVLFKSILSFVCMTLCYCAFSLAKRCNSCYDHLKCFYFFFGLLSCVWSLNVRISLLVICIPRILFLARSFFFSLFVHSLSQFLEIVFYCFQDSFVYHLRVIYDCYLICSRDVWIHISNLVFLLFSICWNALKLAMYVFGSEDYFNSF